MDQSTLLYTLPQWLIFGAIMVIVYGWVEHKKAFRIMGSVLFILLGFYAVYILTGDFLAGKEYLTPEEVMSEELEDIELNEIPFQVKLIPAYWSFILVSLLAIPAGILDWKNKSKYKLFYVLSGVFSLVGFFIIVAALRAI